MKKLITLLLCAGLITSLGGVSFAVREERDTDYHSHQKRLEEKRQEKEDKNELRRENDEKDRNSFNNRVIDENYDKNVNRPNNSVSQSIKSPIKNSHDVKNKFEFWYDNDLDIIETNNPDKKLKTFTVDQNFSTKNADAIVFYTYSAETNKYKLLYDTNAYFDSKGALVFSTAYDGYVIICNGKLLRNSN